MRPAATQGRWTHHRGGGCPDQETGHRTGSAVGRPPVHPRGAQPQRHRIRGALYPTGSLPDPELPCTCLPRLPSGKGTTTQDAARPGGPTWATQAGHHLDHYGAGRVRALAGPGPRQQENRRSCRGAGRQHGGVAGRTGARRRVPPRDGIRPGHHARDRNPPARRAAGPAPALPAPQAFDQFFPSPPPGSPGGGLGSEMCWATAGGSCPGIGFVRRTSICPGCGSLGRSWRVMSGHG